MARKAERGMMPTFTVQMQADNKQSQRIGLCRPKCYLAFTLVESMVVLVVASLIVSAALINLMSLIKTKTFQGQLQQFVSTMQMAAASAAQSDKKYEVIIDFAQQSYLLREITNPDLSVVLEEEIILEQQFGSNCQLSYVIFDDEEYTNESRAKFRVSRSGWQYGGKIVLVDKFGSPYSVLINRLNTMLVLKQGDVDFLVPRLKSEMSF